jgi:hypothetical protein
MRVHRIPSRNSSRRRRLCTLRIAEMEKALVDRFRTQGASFSADAAGELAAATIQGYHTLLSIVNNSRVDLFGYPIFPEDKYHVEKLEKLVTSELHIARGKMLWGLLYNCGAPGNEPSEDEIYLALMNYSAQILRKLL